MTYLYILGHCERVILNCLYPGIPFSGLVDLSYYQRFWNDFNFLVFIIFGWNFCYYYISNGYLRCITLWSVLTIRKTECRNEVFSIWFAVKCKPMKNKRLRIHSVLNLFVVFVSVWRAGWAVQKTINYGEYLCYCTLRELLKIRPHEVKPCSKNDPCQKDHNISSIDFVDFIPLFFECNESILSLQLPLVLAQ